MIIARHKLSKCKKILWKYHWYLCLLLLVVLLIPVLSIFYSKSWATWASTSPVSRCLFWFYFISIGLEEKLISSLPIKGMKTQNKKLKTPTSFGVLDYDRSPDTRIHTIRHVKKKHEKQRTRVLRDWIIKLIKGRIQLLIHWTNGPPKF